MHLPLYHRPSSLAFLDDDTSYLEMLSLILPTDWCIRLFSRVDDFLSQIQVDSELWEEDLWNHHVIIEKWRAGVPLIPQILQYWKNRPDRFALCKVCVVDYAMPAKTGLEVLQTLSRWPSSKVLLTGKADEMIAVNAFNHGLISRFIPKQQANLGNHLTQVLLSQRDAPIPLYEGLWVSTLDKTHYKITQNPEVRFALSKLIQSQQWIEYFIVEQPFGVMALDRAGNHYWLQLELRSDLLSAVELAHLSDHTPEQIQCISQGTHLSNIELLTAIQDSSAPRIAPALNLGEDLGLLGAIFNLPNATLPTSTYARFVNDFPARNISDY